jgi:hypothetical protein
LETIELSGDEDRRILVHLATDYTDFRQYMDFGYYTDFRYCISLNLMIRRRRSLTLAQGWSAATTLGTNLRGAFNPERVPPAANPYRVVRFSEVVTLGLSLRSNPRLRLANACGVDPKFNLMHY